MMIFQDMASRTEHELPLQHIPSLAIGARQAPEKASSGRAHSVGALICSTHHFVFCTSLVPRIVTMSFAGRRRGNKVKKGVQFTVMVVGQSSFTHVFSRHFTNWFVLLFAVLSRRLWHRTYHICEHPLRVRGLGSQNF